jgi:hypothetical protein
VQCLTRKLEEVGVVLPSREEVAAANAARSAAVGTAGDDTPVPPAARSACTTRMLPTFLLIS